MDYSSTNRDFEYPKQSVHNHYSYNRPFDSATYSYNNGGDTLSSLNDFGYPYDSACSHTSCNRPSDSAQFSRMHIDGRSNPLPLKNASNYSPPDLSSVERQYFNGTNRLKYVDDEYWQSDLCQYPTNSSDVIYESSMMPEFQRHGGQTEGGGWSNEYDYHFPPLSSQYMLADCRYGVEYAENGQQISTLNDNTQMEQPRSTTSYMTSATMKPQQMGSATSNFDSATARQHKVESATLCLVAAEFQQQQAKSAALVVKFQQLAAQFQQLQPHGRSATLNIDTAYFQQPQAKSATLAAEFQQQQAKTATLSLDAAEFLQPQAELTTLAVEFQQQQAETATLSLDTAEFQQPQAESTTLAAEFQQQQAKSATLSLGAAKFQQQQQGQSGTVDVNLATVEQQPGQSTTLKLANQNFRHGGQLNWQSTINANQNTTSGVGMQSRRCHNYAWMYQKSHTKQPTRSMSSKINHHPKDSSRIDQLEGQNNNGGGSKCPEQDKNLADQPKANIKTKADSKQGAITYNRPRMVKVSSSAAIKKWQVAKHPKFPFGEQLKMATKQQKDNGVRQIQGKDTINQPPTRRKSQPQPKVQKSSFAAGQANDAGTKFIQFGSLPEVPYGKRLIFPLIFSGGQHVAKQGSKNDGNQHGQKFKDAKAKVRVPKSRDRPRRKSRSFQSKQWANYSYENCSNHTWVPCYFLYPAGWCYMDTNTLPNSYYW